MLTPDNTDKDLPSNNDDYYEEVASQEEMYLEETEEEVIEVLESDDVCSPGRTVTTEPSLDEQRERAVEELITGDSDDPPMSQGTIEEMLNTG